MADDEEEAGAEGGEGGGDDAYDPQRALVAQSLEVNKLRQHVEVLKRANERIRDQYKQEIRSLLQPLIERHRKLQVENGKLQEKIEKLSVAPPGSDEALVEELRKLRHDHGILQKITEGLEGDSRLARRLQAELEEAHTRIEALDVRVADLERERRRLEMLVAERDQTMVELEEKLDQAQNEQRDWKEKHDKLQQTNKDELRGYQQQLGEAIGRYKALEKQHQDALFARDLLPILYEELQAEAATYDELTALFAGERGNPDAYHPADQNGYGGHDAEPVTAEAPFSGYQPSPGATIALATGAMATAGAAAASEMADLDLDDEAFAPVDSVGVDEQAATEADMVGALVDPLDDLPLGDDPLAVVDSFDQPATANPFDLSVEDEPLAAANPFDLSVEDEPLAAANPFDLSVEDEPLAAANPFDLSAEDQPLVAANPFDLSDADEPQSASNPFDLSVEDQPLVMANPFDLTIEDEPATGESFDLSIADHDVTTADPLALESLDDPFAGLDEAEEALHVPALEVPTSPAVAPMDLNALGFSDDEMAVLQDLAGSTEISAEMEALAVQPVAEPEPVAELAEPETSPAFDVTGFSFGGDTPVTVAHEPLPGDVLSLEDDLFDLDETAAEAPVPVPETAEETGAVFAQDALELDEAPLTFGAAGFDEDLAEHAASAHGGEAHPITDTPHLAFDPLAMPDEQAERTLVDRDVWDIDDGGEAVTLGHADLVAHALEDDDPVEAGTDVDFASQLAQSLGGFSETTDDEVEDLVWEDGPIDEIEDLEDDDVTGTAPAGGGVMFAPGAIDAPAVQAAPAPPPSAPAAVPPPSRANAPVVPPPRTAPPVAPEGSWAAAMASEAAGLRHSETGISAEDIARLLDDDDELGAPSQAPTSAFDPDGPDFRIQPPKLEPPSLH